MDKPLDPLVLQRRRRQRLAALAAGLGALAFAAWAVNRVVSPSVDAQDLRIAQVHRGAIANTINAAGVVIPVHEVQLPSPVASRVARVHAKPGQVVAAGELLLELDDAALRVAVDNLSEQIAQQRNRVAGLELAMSQKLKQVNADIELLQLDLESARVKLGRYQRLQAIGATAASDLNAAELLVKRTEIELRQRREQVADTRKATATEVEGARLQESIYEKQLAQQRQLLEQTQVRAPFAGMVTWLLTEDGASVGAGQLVARVSKLQDFRVEATVSDFYARYLAAGQAVRVGYSGQVLGGRVQTVLPEIQDGTVKLLVVLDKPNHPLLRNKLRVDVNIITDQKADALVVDTGPAFNGRGAQEVFVVRDGIARKRSLDIGLGDGHSVEVLGGAAAGERLIVSDMSRYKSLDQLRVDD